MPELSTILDAPSISLRKERALRFAVSTTFLALIPTAYLAVQSSSVAMLSDLLRCCGEFGAIFLSWLILRRASNGDRSYYDYGFGKLEQAGSFLVGCALLLSVLAIAIVATHRLMFPILLTDLGTSVVFSILSVLGNVVMWVHNLRISRLEASPVVEAQWRLFRAKTVASGVVLGALLVCSAAPGERWATYADPVGSLIVCGFLLHSAVLLLSSSMSDLLDRSIEEAFRLAILRVLVEHEASYEGLESIRARRAGSSMFIEVVLEYSGERLFVEVYGAVERTREAITSAVPGSQVLVIPRVRRTA